MINPDDARVRLHELIDSMPDDQVALVWLTFQSMVSGEEDDADYEDDELDTDNA